MHFEPNIIYHIYNQGNNQQKVFFSRENYIFFIQKMRTHILPYGDILCYCLMPNHFHWMVYVRETELVYNPENKTYHGLTPSHPVNKTTNTNPSEGVNSSHTFKQKSLNDSIGILLRSYTRAINKQNDWSGSLFRSKTKAIPCIEEKLRTLKNNNLERDYYAGTCFNYIHQNPVNAGLVKKAKDWEFSSAPDYHGKRNGNLCNMELAKKLEII